MQPLLNPRDSLNETLMFIIGVGTVWLFLGIALFWLMDFDLTPLGVGTALAVTAIPTMVTVGGHELAHYLVADEYCRFENTHFSAFANTTRLTLLSFGGVLLLVLLDVFGGFSLPKWVVLFGVASPGAVVATGRSRVEQCMDETALAGPLFNLIAGAVVLFVGLEGKLQMMTPGMPFDELVMTLTVFLSLYFAFVNSLPVGPLDGRKVVAAREPVTLSLWAIVLVGSVWMLYLPFL